MKSLFFNNKIPSLVFSFEFSLILFLNAGLFQSLPLIEYINQYIHTTALFGVINIFIGIYIFITKKNLQFNKKTLTIFFLFILFSIYVFFSYSQILSFHKADRKVLEYFAIIPWTVFAGLMIINNEKRAKRLLDIIIIFGIFMTIWSISSSYLRDFTTYKKSEIYQSMGRNIGASLILSFVYFIYYKKLNQKLLLVTFLILTTIGLFYSGHRAGFLFSFITILFTIFIIYKQSINKPTKLNLAFIILISTIIIILQNSQRAQYLIERFTVGEERTLDAKIFKSRLNMYDKSYELIKENPIFGIGFGGFSKKSDLKKYRHPHNLFIEILLELGCIGLMLAICFLFSWTIFMYKLKIVHYFNLLSVFTLFLFYFMNCMVSGNITDNRVFFAITAVLISNTIMQNNIPVKHN